MDLPTENPPAKLADAIEVLRQGGLDLTASFDASRYNRAVAEHASLRPLDLFGRAATFGLVIGNSWRLWSTFRAAYHARPALRAAPDPLDAYVAEVVVAAAGRFESANRVYLASAGSGERVSMIHAADVSGLAPRGPAHLAVHPIHGPWVGLRAVLVVDAPPPPDPAPSSSSPCTGCEAPCRVALDEAVARAGAVPRGQGDIAASWRDWVAVRDACPVGRESRYGEAQLRYHYTQDRDALDAPADPPRGSR